MAFLKELLFLGFESFGRYYGSHRAFVADNNDPENLNRLKLIIPEVMGEEVYNYWAPAKNQYSGKGHGCQVLPEKGEVVWVEFEGGIPERPIWLHGHFGVGDKPKNKQGKDFNDVKSYYFHTPQGNIIYINDTKKVISITSQEGDRIEINTQAVSIDTDKKISLGKLNKSDQPALLGDNTQEALNEIHSLLRDIVMTLQIDIQASNLAGKPFLMRAGMTQRITNWLTTITSIKAKLNKIKSKKVTLD